MKKSRTSRIVGCLFSFSIATIISPIIATIAIPTLAKDSPNKTGRSTEDFQALVVSADNSFDASEKDLEFASLDASRLTKALITAGRIPESKILNLKNPSVAEFDQAIAGLSQKASQKFMFYFSGHSTENGLHLKDGSITKNKFHDLLAKISAKVKIVILDSCFSGALKSKGVKKDKPIELVQYNVDEPTGSVILTSSSGKEFSYESDKLKGSIFSYHLISGLYGQADSNGDGLVTIDELYQYVYSQTKFQSMVSGGKVQSPEFESKLTGQGALVVAYPSKINGQLLLANQVNGELTLASAKGINFFKFYKNKGEDRTISLPKGQYDVTLTDEERVGQGQVEVVENQSQALKTENFVWKKREVPSVRAKGAQSKFLIGVAAQSHPSFYETEEASGMGEFFLLSPSTEALMGRWRLAVHAGGESHQIKGSDEKVNYSRLTIGGEGNYTGWNRLGNEWLVGFRMGTYTVSDTSALSKTATGANRSTSSSLTHFSVGSRFYPTNYNFNWDALMGFDSIKAANQESKTVTTLGLSISY